MSGVYYESPYALLLGIGIYYFNMESQKIEVIRVNLISDMIDPDGLTTVRLFRFMLIQDFFKKIPKYSRYVFWSDCGPHFRCSTCMHYFLKDLTQDGLSSEYNFFVEKHGKSKCDEHFSVLTKYITNYSYKFELKSSNEVRNAIDYYHILNTNNNDVINEHSKITSVHTIIFDNDFDFQEYMPIKELKITDLQCYYNFFNNEKRICSKVLSDREQIVVVAYKTNEFYKRFDTIFKDKSENPQKGM